MHEYALVEELLEQAEEQVHAKGGRAVKAVSLRVGEDSGYSVESLRQAFETLKEGTRAAEAEMIIAEGEGNAVTLESIVLSV